LPPSRTREWGAIDTNEIEDIIAAHQGAPEAAVIGAARPLIRENKQKQSDRECCVI
jgi:hypothetical protein